MVNSLKSERHISPASTHCLRGQGKSRYKPKARDRNRALEPVARRQTLLKKGQNSWTMTP